MPTRASPQTGSAVKRRNPIGPDGKRKIGRPFKSKEKRVCVEVFMPPTLRDAARAIAQQKGQTLSDGVIDGLMLYSWLSASGEDAILSDAVRRAVNRATLTGATLFLRQEKETLRLRDGTEKEIKEWKLSTMPLMGLPFLRITPEGKIELGV